MTTTITIIHDEDAKITVDHDATVKVVVEQVPDGHGRRRTQFSISNVVEDALNTRGGRAETFIENGSRSR